MKKFTKDDFIKVGNKYMLKDSQSVYFDEKEVEMIIDDEEMFDILEKVNKGHTCNCCGIKEEVKEEEKDNGKENGINIVKKTTKFKK